MTDAGAVANRVRSPCISVCSLDEEDICVGCYRSVGEITDWSAMTDSERREVLLRAQLRCAQKYPGR